MEAELIQIAEQVGKVAAALAGAFLALNKTKGALIDFANTKPMLRKAIAADLELFRLMKENEPGYKELKDHIKGHILKMIAKEDRKEIVKGNWPQVVVGILMTVGFGYWTYYIFNNDDVSNWFAILTIWMALAGIGFLVGVSEKKSTDKTKETEANDSGKE